MTGYAVVIEGDGDAFSAYVPELPGCVAAAASIPVVERLIRDAIGLHVDSLRQNGDPVPEPITAAVRLFEAP